MSASLQPAGTGFSVHGDSPGKNTGVGYHALFQGIFPTQGLNPHLLSLLHLADRFFTTEPLGSHWGGHISTLYLHLYVYILIGLCLYLYIYTHTYIYRLFYFKDWLIWAQMVMNLPAMPETQVQSLGQENPLEKAMTTHSCILAWRILWTEKPGGLQSIELHKVGHDWVT